MFLTGKIRKVCKLIRELPVKFNLAEQDLVLSLYSGLRDKKTEERIMIDVGAQFGSSLIKFAKTGWKVYCFEPDDNNRAILKRNLQKQGLENVTVDERAVSNLESKAVYYKSELSSGISSLIKFHSSHKEAKEVEITTLSAFCSKNSISNFEFLKIDTEGNDLRVIEGLDLKNHRPSVILCEYEDLKTKLVGYTKEDIVKFLVTNGYRLLISEWYPVTGYGQHHKWKKITDEIGLVDINSWGNIIAVNPELYELFLRIVHRRFRKKNIFLVNPINS